jgi:cyclopropane fatty-acyl-phospholipid synthase-like methyltransferase
MTDVFSDFYRQQRIAEQASTGAHRELIGGLWDEIGALQLDYLKANGLTPRSKLLDIGCGSLRLGVRAVGYLEAGNYWGTDLNQSLLDAGYDKEIVPAGLEPKLSRDHLIVDSDFSFAGVPREVDVAIAQSVFTHLPFNHLRLCLANLAGHVSGPCTLFATVFIAPDDALSKPFDQGGVQTYPHRDPYHYSLADLRHAAAGLPWDVDYIGHWGHPRHQKMVAFRKTEATGTGPSSETRRLSIEESLTLPPGADHYRAYVGPGDRYDFISATQFALLFALGLRDNHRVLDFGCGSLRLGRLLIPFLQRDRYFGIDPNKWLIDEALDREVGRDIVGIKAPAFAYNDDFSTEVFQARFDYIMAQSILTHSGPDLVHDFLRSAARTLSDSGLLLFSYIKSAEDDPPMPAAGWHYPECVSYSQEWMLGKLRDAGLHGRPLPWFHPGASWIAAAHKPRELPKPEHLRFLSGAVLRAPPFAASTASR